MEIYTVCVYLSFRVSVCDSAVFDVYNCIWYIVYVIVNDLYRVDAELYER